MNSNDDSRSGLVLISSKERLDDLVHLDIYVPLRRCHSDSDVTEKSLSQTAIYPKVAFQDAEFLPPAEVNGLSTESGESEHGPAGCESVSTHSIPQPRLSSDSSATTTDGGLNQERIGHCLEFISCRSISAVELLEPADQTLDPKDLEDIRVHLLDLEKLLGCLVEGLQSQCSSTGTQETKNAFQGVELNPPPADWYKCRAGLQVLLDMAVTARHMWTSHRKLLGEFLYKVQQSEEHIRLLQLKLAKQTAANTRLRRERQEFQNYLKEKECEWFTVEKSLKMETEFLRTRIYEMMKNTRESDALWHSIQSFLYMQYDKEQAIALDTAKQNKINELRLLVYKQQIVMRELEEQRCELEAQLRDAIIAEGKDSDCSNNSEPTVSCLSDVLRCDYMLYLPHHSCHPQIASLQVLGIGGYHLDLGFDQEIIFDPTSVKLGRPLQPDEPDLAERMLQYLQQHGPASPNFCLND